MVTVTMMNTKNSPKRHAVVAIASIIGAGAMYFMGYRTGVILGAISYVLLFLTVVIGPILVVFPRLRRRLTGEFPFNWRSELGIWFVIWAVVHVAYIVDNPGNIDVLWRSSWGFTATVATVLAVLVLFTSNTKAFSYMGAKAWKWHQSHATYIIFYLLSAHIWQFSTVIGNRPDDPVHYLYLIMFFLVMLLHLVGFIKVIRFYNQNGKYPSYIR